MVRSTNNKREKEKKFDFNQQVQAIDFAVYLCIDGGGTNNLELITDTICFFIVVFSLNNNLTFMFR